MLGLGAGVVAMPLALAVFNRRAFRPVALPAGGVLLAVLAVFAFDLAVGLPSPAGCVSQAPSLTASARILRTSGVEGSNIAVRLALADIAFQGFLDRPALGWAGATVTRTMSSINMRKRHFTNTVRDIKTIYITR